MSQPGVLPSSPSPTSPSPGWGQPPSSPPQPPQRDSTRTIAIVALVVAGITLLWQVATTFLPMLLFGFLGFGGGFLDEEFGAPTEFGFGGGQVAVAADGTVSAAALTAAVRELVGVGEPSLPPIDEITCDAAPRIAQDVSVLCRAPAEDWYFIVRFVDGSGEFEVQAVPGQSMMGMP